MSLKVGMSTYDYTGMHAGTAETVLQRTPLINDTASRIPFVGSNKRAGETDKTGAVECRTCQSRKYMDESDDPGVSFKVPTHVTPESSASAVISHEQEHVSRESSKAEVEGREVVSQSVRIYTDICPECGRVYVSGGKTTTVTEADNKPDYFMDNMKKALVKHFGLFIDKRI